MMARSANELGGHGVTDPRIAVRPLDLSLKGFAWLGCELGSRGYVPVASGRRHGAEGPAAGPGLEVPRRRPAQCARPSRRASAVTPPHALADR